METISFFSFKGGVGRTNLLLNVAAALASGSEKVDYSYTNNPFSVRQNKNEGKFVVVADWDIHAPGLTVMELMQQPNLDTIIPRRGVLDYLEALIDSSNPPVPDPASLAFPTQLGADIRAKFISQDDAKENSDFLGDIYMISAGRFIADSSEQNLLDLYYKQLQLVQSYNLSSYLIDSSPGENRDRRLITNLFVECVEKIKHPITGKSPDYLLIDSRTGITEIGDLLLNSLFDRMVLVSGLNQQNLAGFESTVRSLQQRITPWELQKKLTWVFAPVPTGEEQWRQNRIAAINDLRNKLARKDDEGSPEPMPIPHFISYHPYIALSEIPMVLAYPLSDPSSSILNIVNEIRNKAIGQGEVSGRIGDKVDKALPANITTNDNLQFKKSPMYNMPKWNWANPQLQINALLPDIVEADIPLINATARTLSLSYEEKLRIIDEYPNLTQFQKDELLYVFSDERSEFDKLIKTEAVTIAGLLVKSVDDWLQVLINKNLIAETSIEILGKLVSTDNVENLGSWGEESLFWGALSDWLKEKKEWQGAVNAGSEAIKLGLTTMPIFASIGNICIYQLQEYEQAIEIYQQAVKKYPEDDGLCYELARANYLLGNLEIAKEQLQMIIQRNSQYYLAYSLLGEIESNSEKYQEAEKFYLQAIKIKINFVNAYVNLACNYIHQGQYEKAKLNLLKALELDHNCIYSKLNLAELHIILNELSEAQKIIDGIELAKLDDPTSIFGYYIVKLILALVQGECENLNILADEMSTIRNKYSNIKSGWNFKDVQSMIKQLPADAQEYFNLWAKCFSEKGAKPPEADKIPKLVKKK